MSRGFQAVLTAACFAFTTLAVSPVFGISEAQATTVKSSKSNTSDRMGGGGGGKGAAGRATTVKSSKSNSSDRMGGSGGKGAAGQ